MGVVPIVEQGAIGEKECSQLREPLVPSSEITSSRLPETFIGVGRLCVIVGDYNEYPNKKNRKF